VIFVSHNHKDKTVVEQFALRLREAFGQDEVFYDSWSIQPGDGIIDKMSAGLEKCELFLFFVSKNSLQSKMVELEWQNAIIKATQGKTKIIPVKLDDCMMPAVMLQTLYIDLFAQGLEIATRQVVDVATGKNTFASGPQQFANLRAYVFERDIATMIEIHAIHFMEPITQFLVLIHNNAGEIKFQTDPEGMHISGFNKDVPLNDGRKFNAQYMAIDRSTTPSHPFVIKATPTEGHVLKFEGILHHQTREQWVGVPIVMGKPAS
jgi:hypothetical protein